MDKVIELKHTPGPWETNHRASTTVCGLECSEVFIPAKGEDLGEWIGYIRGNSKNERIANAQRLNKYRPAFYQASQRTRA